MLLRRASGLHLRQQRLDQSLLLVAGVRGYRLRRATRPELITRRVSHADTPILLKHALTVATRRQQGQKSGADCDPFRALK
jgi:hypothetical protein